MSLIFSTEKKYNIVPSGHHLTDTEQEAGIGTDKRGRVCNSVLLMMNVVINSLKEQITYLHFHQISTMENVKKTVRDLHVIFLTTMELLTQVFLARRVQWQVKAIGHQTTQIFQRV